MPNEKPIEILAKDYIDAMIWTWKEFGPANTGRWTWTIYELNKAGKFSFENIEDALRFKLIWG